ncbi:hypothetical protein HY382_00790 [Candidatus Curtissbacteria bacterium]|nr:hypothetical protein [Candidatus Curtissbacteria bacterium]
MKNFNHQKTKKVRSVFVWRAAWYCVVIWILTFISAAFFVFPWFYIVLPFLVFATTSYYFRKVKGTLEVGLNLAIFWFFVLLILDVLQIIGPYYKNAVLYSQDMRNWFSFPLVLLIPVIYGMVIENRKLRRKRRKVNNNFALPKAGFTLR